MSGVAAKRDQAGFLRAIFHSFGDNLHSKAVAETYHGCGDGLRTSVLVEFGDKRPIELQEMNGELL